MKPKHLQAHLDEFVFRYNRRRTDGVARIAARTIQKLFSRPPKILRDIIRETTPYMAFRS